MNHNVEVAPARPDELLAALRLVFQHFPAAERETRVAQSLELIRRGEVKRESIQVARDGSGLRGALVYEPLPGANGLVWPPQLATRDTPDAIADQLVLTALTRLREHGSKLVQTLLGPSETAHAAPLLRHGFRHITSLWYLRHDLVLPADLVATKDSLCCEPYARCDAAAFHRVLLQSYEGTLDCPEINGVRVLAEILEGHRSQGIHDPEHWWLARVEGEPVAVLLLTATPDEGSWDVSYLGVVPSARGRGVGRALMVRALLEARLLKARALTLAVDGRNLPARHLYRRLGFVPCDLREVFLAILDPPSAPNATA